MIEVSEMENKPDFYKEMPIGLAMSLGMNEYAMDFYAGLNQNTRQKIKSYIQDCNNGKEAKEKINETVQNLEKHNLEFLN